VSTQTCAARPFSGQFDTIIIFVVENRDTCCHAAGIAVQRGRADLSRMSGRGLAGMERRDRGERGETRGPCLGPRALGKPGHDPIHIDRCGGRDVLQVGFLEPPVPGPNPTSLLPGAISLAETVMRTF
jgi:hypothetical protein